MMIARVTGLPHLVGNMGRAVRNLGIEMTHNHELLRYNAFPLAIILQATLRLIQAHYSAYRERNTENGPFRYRQAIDATLREPLGIFAQFGLLRIIENFIKKRIDHHLGLEHSRPKGIISAISGAMKHWWRKNPDFNIDDKFAGYGMLVERTALKFADERKFQKNLVERLPKLQKWLPVLRGKSAEAAAKWLRTWVPLMVAAPISVLVAGYALEKFIRNYAGTIVNGVTRAVTGQDASAPKEKSPPTEAHPAVARSFSAPQARQNGATQYFHRLYREREHRFGLAHPADNASPSAFSRLG